MYEPGISIYDDAVLPSSYRYGTRMLHKLVSELSKPSSRMAGMTSEPWRSSDIVSSRSWLHTAKKLGDPGATSGSWRVAPVIDGSTTQRIGPGGRWRRSSGLQPRRGCSWACRCCHAMTQHPGVVCIHATTGKVARKDDRSTSMTAPEREPSPDTRWALMSKSVMLWRKTTSHWSAGERPRRPGYSRLRSRPRWETIHRGPGCRRCRESHRVRPRRRPHSCQRRRPGTGFGFRGRPGSRNQRTFLQAWCATASRRCSCRRGQTQR